MSFDIATFFHNVWNLLCFDPAKPLVFNSGAFWCLFLIFLPIYGILKNKRTKMMVFVIAFSLYFFYKSSGGFFLLLVATSILDWFFALQIKIETTKKMRRFWLWLSIAISVGILGLFKYSNFVIWNINELMKSNFQPLDLIMPLGISFYTFKTISYVVDVYKGKIEPTESWLDYLFYLSFFPALAMGPIVRAREFLPQLRDNKEPTKQMIYSGFWLVLLGVIKKAVFADYLAQYSDIAFGSADGYSGFELAMAMIGYTMQIYCDFSGYSDMAIGLGRIMGFDLGINFNFPYRSLNPTEFWKRWHITLSMWLMDYVYIPLGGNRKGKLRQYFNLMATMLIGGLWHGAAWNYIVWGGVHGVGLIVHKITKKPLDNYLPSDNKAVKFVSWLLAYIFIVITMTIFGAGDVGTSWTVIRKSFTEFDPAYFTFFVKARYTWCILLTVIFALHFVPVKIYERLASWFVGCHWLVKLLIFVAVVQLVIQFSSAEVKPFIYNQF
jgi:D-alanyl-lipoteichoic acid acyltransferase DltB (MBOAT superfamily)